MIRKSFLNDNLTFTLYGNDLFDKSRGRSTIHSKDIMTELFNKSEQRNVRLTISYSFNTARSKYKGTGAGENEKNRM